MLANDNKKYDYLDNVEAINLDDTEKYMDLYEQIAEVFKKNKVSLFDSYVVVSAMSSSLLQEILMMQDMDNI